MKTLNCNPSSWDIERLNNALKVHNLEQDVENLREECNDLKRELQKYMQKVLLHYRLSWKLGGCCIAL